MNMCELALLSSGDTLFWSIEIRTVRVLTVDISGAKKNHVKTLHMKIHCQTLIMIEI